MSVIDAPFQRPHIIRAWSGALLQYEVSEAEMAQIMDGNVARLFAL